MHQQRVLRPKQRSHHSSLSSRISANLRLIAWVVSYIKNLPAYLFSLGGRNFARNQCSDLLISSSNYLRRLVAHQGHQTAESEYPSYAVLATSIPLGRLDIGMCVGQLEDDRSYDRDLMVS